MIELNNPFNIRISTVPWHNKDVPPRNKQFETFPTPEDGLRAGIKNTLHAQTIHGYKSIDDIISHLSPPSENDTAGYIVAVCDECGAQAEEFYDLKVALNLALLSKAIIKRENCKQPYTDDLINRMVAAVLGG